MSIEDPKPKIPNPDAASRIEGMTEQLFTGQPGIFGGLSNENDLVEACPEIFKSPNDWSKYAMSLFYSGGSTTNWKWKSEDKAERRRQEACLKALFESFDVSHEFKEAVAGWMLFEMLTEVPNDISNQNK